MDEPQFTAEQFAQRAFDLNLLDERELRSIWAEFGTRNITLDDFVQMALRRGVLTNYQADRLLRGELTGFFYGEYKVLYKIGEGSFARVYRAANKDTDQVVAVKVLRRNRAEDRDVAGQFHREGAMGATLRHPNIVPIYEIASKDETHYLVMEFLEGNSLREFLKVRKQLKPEEAVRLMCDITAGMSYAFDRGVTHRDLSLSNVFITSRGRAKLVDFGLAAIAENAAEKSIDNAPHPRTIDYVGLERATGVRKGDMRSDLFFAGCMFYQMLTGVPPLAETTDRLQRLCMARYTEITPIQQLAPALPHWITRIVTRAMELDPDERYQKPSEMLADLKLAGRRLANPEQFEDADDGADAAAAGRQSTVLVLEANVKLQDVFRQRIKELGYRVLVTSNPHRALNQLEQDSPAAQCVLVSSGDLGEAALDVFNRLTEDLRTEPIPAILLLDEDHHAWEGRAKLSEHRIVAQMPLRLSELRQLLAKLLPL